MLHPCRRTEKPQYEKTLLGYFQDQGLVATDAKSVVPVLTNRLKQLSSLGEQLSCMKASSNESGGAGSTQAVEYSTMMFYLSERFGGVNRDLAAECLPPFMFEGEALFPHGFLDELCIGIYNAAVLSYNAVLSDLTGAAVQDQSKGGAAQTSAILKNSFKKLAVSDELLGARLNDVLSNFPGDSVRVLPTLNDARMLIKFALKAVKYQYALHSAATCKRHDALAKLAAAAASEPVPRKMDAGVRHLPLLLLTAAYRHQAEHLYGLSDVPSMTEVLGYIRAARKQLNTITAKCPDGSLPAASLRKLFPSMDLLVRDLATLEEKYERENELVYHEKALANVPEIPELDDVPSTAAGSTALVIPSRADPFEGLLPSRDQIVVAQHSLAEEKANRADAIQKARLTIHRVEELAQQCTTVSQKTVSNAAYERAPEDIARLAGIVQRYGRPLGEMFGYTFDAMSHRLNGLRLLDQRINDEADEHLAQLPPSAKQTLAPGLRIEGINTRMQELKTSIETIVNAQPPEIILDMFPIDEAALNEVCVPQGLRTLRELLSQLPGEVKAARGALDGRLADIESVLRHMDAVLRELESAREAAVTQLGDSKSQYVTTCVAVSGRVRQLLSIVAALEDLGQVLDDESAEGDLQLSQIAASSARAAASLDEAPTFSTSPAKGRQSTRGRGGRASTQASQSVPEIEVTSPEATATPRRQGRGSSARMSNAMKQRISAAKANAANNSLLARAQQLAATPSPSVRSASPPSDSEALPTKRKRK